MSDSQIVALINFVRKSGSLTATLFNDMCLDKTGHVSCGECPACQMSLDIIVSVFENTLTKGVIYSNAVAACDTQSDVQESPFALESETTLNRSQN